MKCFPAVAVFLMLLAVQVGAAWAGDWPQWRYDAARGAASPDDLPDDMSLRWVLKLPQPQPAWPASQPSLRFDVSYSPVVAGKMLYVPSMVTDNVTAYDTESGERCWRFFSGGPVRLAPVVCDGKLYFGSDDGFLYCLDAKEGTLLWKYRGGPYRRNILGNERLISTWPVRGGPVVKDGRVYFTAGVWPFMGIFVHAVDAHSGKSVWTNSGAGDLYTVNPHSAPAFSNFVPRGHLAITENGLLAPGGRTPPGTYDLKTGKLIEFNFAKHGGRSSHGPVPITAGSRKFSCSKGQISSENWKGEVDGTVWNMLAADDKLFAVTAEGSIYCFGAGDGEPKTIDETGAIQEDGKRPWARKTAELLDKTGKTEGYCVVLGVGSGGLAEELASRTRLRIIVVEPDEKKVDTFRRRMTEAGLYGSRVSAVVGTIGGCAMPPYLADLLVSEDKNNAPLPGTQLEKAVLRMLRPYGGVACFPHGDDDVLVANGHWRTLEKPGPLVGAADWTHNYADAANSVVSRDARVRAPLGLLWFGNGPPNDEVLPRHGHGPSPQVAAGRLFIEGADMIRGLDIYSGRLLWQRELPGLGEFYDNTSHQAGAGEIGSNYVSLSDSVYVVYGERILKFDAADGQTQAEFTATAADSDSTTDAERSPLPNWGGLAAFGDTLIATSIPTTDEGKHTRFASASRTLIAMDRHTGSVLWRRASKYGFRHNNIALGAGKVFCIDGLSQAKLQTAKRRGAAVENYRPCLMALDIDTGKPVWSTDENVFGTFLNYSAEHDVLLQSGSANRDRAADESKKGMVAYRGKDGSLVWQNLELAHAGPCLLHGEKIISQGPAYSLLTGKPITRRHPLSGDAIPWTFTRNYGCNTAVASKNLITFRSGAAGYFNIENDGGTGNFGGFKSGCSSNLIAAGGLLSAPEYTRTCTCNYQNQTSLAMIHDPNVETWTFNAISWDGKPIRRVGINFGAPGDRRDESGTLWLDYPSIGGKSPDLPVDLEGEKTEYFRIHSSLLRAGEGELSWVAASGVVGAERIAITLANDRKPRKYTIRLHFAEVMRTAPGKRTFDISLQGRKVLERFDVVARSGGPRRALVKQFDGVTVSGQLQVTLRATGPLPAILCGIEAIAE